jgi:hypothetical protein
MPQIKNSDKYIVRIDGLALNDVLAIVPSQARKKHF